MIASVCIQSSFPLLCVTKEFLTLIFKIFVIFWKGKRSYILKKKKKSLKFGQEGGAIFKKKSLKFKKLHVLHFKEMK